MWSDCFFTGCFLIVLAPVVMGDTHVIFLLPVLPVRAGCPSLSRPLLHKDIKIRALISAFPSVRDFNPSLLMEKKPKHPGHTSTPEANYNIL